MRLNTATRVVVRYRGATLSPPGWVGGKYRRQKRGFGRSEEWILSSSNRARAPNLRDAGEACQLEWLNHSVGDGRVGPARWPLRRGCTHSSQLQAQPFRTLDRRICGLAPRRRPVLRPLASHRAPASTPTSGSYTEPRRLAGARASQGKERLPPGADQRRSVNQVTWSSETPQEAMMR